jgi:glycosyltransferase involved in cell wall biosynthesis
MNIRYVIITPVRDEEAYIRETIENMVRQTIRPARWVIVNDGSTDRTGEIIDSFAREHDWIRCQHRKNRGFRKSGGGVVEAFDDGYRSLDLEQWDYIVKFDGDLSFEPDYFERCFRQFQEDERLGVGGGVIYHVLDGVKELESQPSFHVRGATKIYRRACWQGIGGFWPAPGWDTLDEVKANMLGWKTRSFPELHLIHHRVTGSADGVWGGTVKNGKADYICGYHPLFMLAKCLIRVTQKPFLMGSVALAYGFLAAFFKRTQRVDDPALIRYLRQEQLSRLCGGQTIWK